MIGADTTVLIDLFRNDKHLINFLNNLNEKIILTRMNYLELLFGLNLTNADHLTERSYYDSLFDESIVFDLDKKSSEMSSEIFWNLVKNGQVIDKFDCIIAGIYLSHGVKKILTRNVKHFERIKGVEVISY